MKWQTQCQLILTCASRGRRLVVTAGEAPLGWAVMCLEGPDRDNETTPNDQDRADELLEDHAHQYLGTRDTLQEAISLGEKYARWWQRTGVISKACECEGIA